MIYLSITLSAVAAFFLNALGDLCRWVKKKLAHRVRFKRGAYRRKAA